MLIGSKNPVGSFWKQPVLVFSCSGGSLFFFRLQQDPGTISSSALPMMFEPQQRNKSGAQEKIAGEQGRSMAALRGKASHSRSGEFRARP